MRRGWKIAIGVVAALVVVLVVNALFVDGETKSAEVTVPNGRLLDLPAGQTQVVEHGPRDGDPIVLVHCFTCGIDWWDGMIPALSRRHRVVAIDLLGHDGAAKPSSGYAIPDQAELVAQAMQRLDVRDAVVVGHSLGGTVTTALAEQSPHLVKRAVVIDQAPDQSYEKDFPITGKMLFWPGIGEALWQITPDFAIEDGLAIAFAPDYDVPDQFVDDFKRMTYSSYEGAVEGENDYSEEIPLDRRFARTGVPLLVVFGLEDQIYDAKAALAAYARVPGAQTAALPGIGHSPNVEAPARTAQLVLGFGKRPRTP